MSDVGGEASPRRFGRNDLSRISIEISGKNALIVATMLRLGGLATSQLNSIPTSNQDSLIMRNALKDLKRK